jgi:hypothetical protein
MIRRFLIPLLLLLLGLALCYAYDLHVYQSCRNTGSTHAACLAIMGNI